MEFEWDDDKAGSNFAKHGVLFVVAMHVFDDPDLVTIRSPYPEEVRWKTTGGVNGAVLTVVHTSRRSADGHYIRIISARPASREERARYAKG